MAITQGLFAALPTPVHADGRLDEATLDRLIEFVIGAGVDGVCIGGATGEYPHFEAAARKAVIRSTAARLPKDRDLFVGIGGSSMHLTIDLGQTALAAGARAVLLPMPMFFRYGQEDLTAYCAEVSQRLRGPCLLYDLPDFTNGLAAETTLALLSEDAFIVGIKDSSGREENLTAFAEARRDRDWTLLVGDDRLLRPGIRAGWDGGISGIAAFCPELLVALYRSLRAGREQQAARLQALLEDVIREMAPFPTPWAIRIGLSARGIDTGPLPLPIASSRHDQIRRFTQWFGEFLNRLESSTSR